MLKATNAFAGIANAKCGEIYCQSSSSFSIVCTFCDIKCFNFGDFLLHFKNAHFENDLLKGEGLPTLQSRPVSVTMERVPTLKQELADAAEARIVSYNDNEDDEDEDAIVYDFVADVNDYDHDECDSYDANPQQQQHDVANIVNWTGMNNTLAANVGTHRKRLRKPREKLTNGCTEDQSIIEDVVDEDMEDEYVLEQQKNDDDDDDADDANDDDDEGCDSDTNDKEYKPAHRSKQKEHKCVHCERVYINKGSLTQHMKREHEHTEVINCAECELELNGTARQLDLHLIEVHGGIPCSQCPKRYKGRRELLRHEIKHTGERNVICDFDGCDKRFFTTRNMHSHRKVHSLEKNFVCENCGYSCRNKETLRIHARIHTGERPYECKTCSKSFPSHSRLREHEAMHSSSRPHVCTVCGATFARQKALYHHKFLHSEKKQFVCKICGNAYAQQAGLAGHMRKHKEGVL